MCVCWVIYFQSQTVCSEKSVGIRQADDNSFIIPSKMFFVFFHTKWHTWQRLPNPKYVVCTIVFVFFSVFFLSENVLLY